MADLEKKVTELERRVPVQSVIKIEPEVICSDDLDISSLTNNIGPILEEKDVKLVNAKEILEEQLKVLQSAQQKCLDVGPYEDIVPIAKTIIDITNQLANLKTIR